MPTMWGETDLEDTILGWFYLVARHWRDRSPQAMLENVNKTTGLAERESDMLPAYRAVRGRSLALMQTPTPTGFAASMIRYHSDASVTCKETQDCDGCRQLDQKPRGTWSEEEIEMQSALTYRIKLAAHRLGSLGLVTVQPGAMDGEPHPLGEDGLTMRFGITHTGLEEAFERAKRNPPWDSMVRGWKEAITKAEFAKAPEWLQAQARHSSSAISV